MARLDSVKGGAHHGASALRNNQTFERLTRIGFAAKGLVYLMIGVLALLAAFQSGGQTTDQQGAVQRISAQPFGEFALFVIAVGLLAYAAWRLTGALLNVESTGAATRIGHALAGLAYAGIAVYAFQLVLGSGAGPGGDQMTRTWTARFMDMPAGRFLVAGGGLAMIGAGLAQVYMGWKEKFKKHLHLRQIDGSHKHWAIRAGKAGYIARGIVFSVMGILLIAAAVKHDASEASGLEGSLDTLAAQPMGQWLLAFVAAGLACFGIYSLIEARYRKVSSD